jgi:hypothetical protein
MIQKKQVKNIFCQESAMPHPIVCLDTRFRQYLEHWQALFSRPQFQHFVTVLLALIVGSQGLTLLHLKRAVAGSKSLASLSRFLAQAPWKQESLHALAWSRFVDHLSPCLQQDLSRQRALQPVGLGRPRKLFVTGVPCAWPRNAEHQVWVHVVSQVWVHVVSSSVKSLYRCQLIIIRQHLDDPVSRTRFWASSDLQADVEQLLTHISSCWDIKVFFEDVKELLGIDHYQLMSAQGLLRYWSLCWIAFSFLEEHRVWLQTHHRLLVAWITEHVLQGTTSEYIADLLAA